MCGIIGYIGDDNAISVVLEGLKLLEYRGYDSSGIAFPRDDRFEIIKCKGKIRELQKRIYPDSIIANLALGHTRWATHGEPSDENAHPHRSDRVVIVHNGIIENYRELKTFLIDKGYTFLSQTDTEVVAHLLDYNLRRMPLKPAIRETVKRLRGAYAVVLICSLCPDMLIGIRKDSPLVLGVADEGYYLASDVPAFLHRTKDVVFLENEEVVYIRRDGFTVEDFSGRNVEKKVTTVPWSPALADKEGYRHYMLKEIHEQPRSLADTLRGRILYERLEINREEFLVPESLIKGKGRCFITACGTSYYAAMVGKYMIEQLSRIPVEVDLASEFRYRNPVLGPDDLVITITQSGETADTLAAQRLAKQRGARTFCICNVLGSTAAREADGVIYTHSGPEIGVASTKAFTSQLVILYLYALVLGEMRENVSVEERIGYLQHLMELPEKVEETLRLEEEIHSLAKNFYESWNFLYMARGILYPIALEGALKLKEISYIHAEGYAAGEMKHGPIALVEPGLPVLFLLQKGSLLEKTLSNIEEVKARGATVIVVKAKDTDIDTSKVNHLIEVPSTETLLEPVLMVVPLQLLAYYIGVERGYDVDQPRNLAKSVTVE